MRPTIFVILFISVSMLGGMADAVAQTQTDDYERFGIYAKTAPRPDSAAPVPSTLPLVLEPGDTVALIGNTLFERLQHDGDFEAMLQTQFPELKLKVRNLAWSADEVTLQPRPDNFADTEQHLSHEQADVIFAAFGFNESFAGKQGLPDFRDDLTTYLESLKTKAFNGESAARIVLVSPIANENVTGVPAADLNNEQIEQYTEVMRQVAAEQQVGFVDLFAPTRGEMESPGNDLTINGVHLNRAGNQLLASTLFTETFQLTPPQLTEQLRQAVVDKNRQYFRRFRPLNTFYYTGGRNKTYGYLDFLPAMQNFDLMVANRDQRIWDLAAGKQVPEGVDDSNLPELPAVDESRGANQWMTAAEEQKAFQVDPRFELNLFAGEEQFPDLANPIQMRWDSRGRLWVSCSTTYPHVYPGQEPNDKIVILEDTDGDGRADDCKVFADDLHIPLSFVLGHGGVYVSEQPNLTFLEDTDGDDRADRKTIVLSGFGTEDSHHSLHDFVWTPDGALLFRESIFHHSQVETPYGPVRQQNSGWFRFEPDSQRLTSFGTYPSTNPWGVTFDDWGQHMASHPVYAAAFHSIDPPYGQQHARPRELQAYSGTCGHEFIDFASFPAELQGCFAKARYKPTNRIELHRWNRGDFGYSEEYLGDLLFSTNLSFIPVDLGYGPRGAMYICDWYNPIKGHMQYSLRDERRDRHSGRIWRITAKDHPLSEPVNFADSSVQALLELLKRPEYRIRYWAKRELRNRPDEVVLAALNDWIEKLDRAAPRYRHHQLEAVWLSRGMGRVRKDLVAELLSCELPEARSAATEQLRDWRDDVEQAEQLLEQAANDADPIVRMQAAIAASYLGTHAAFEALLDILKQPRQDHVEYAVISALGSKTMRPFWANQTDGSISDLLREAAREQVIKEPTPTAREAQFDQQTDLKTILISTVPERMLFTVTDFAVLPGQPVKLVFTNPDATDHNLVIVKPGALADVGMAANEMAKDPRNAKSDFIPPDKRDAILHATRMIGPMRASRVDVLRFTAPTEPGLYPYVCTFPGHWIVMNGLMVVAGSDADASEMLASAQPSVVNEWTMADFAQLDQTDRPNTPQIAVRGMTAFVKARCHQCHIVAGHGVNLGPDLAESAKKLKGTALLRQMINPSTEIHEKYRNHQFITVEGRVIVGVIMREDKQFYHIATNLLTPHSLTKLRKRDVEEKIASKISPMPVGLLNVLSQAEILDLLTFVESGGDQLPKQFQHGHSQ